MFFDEFLARQKVGQFKSQISAALADKKGVAQFLEGSAREAVCRGGERGGVMLPESIQFRIQHAAPKGAAEKATASAADPYENSCW